MKCGDDETFGPLSGSGHETRPLHKKEFDRMNMMDRIGARDILLIM